MTTTVRPPTRIFPTEGRLTAFGTVRRVADFSTSNERDALAGFLDQQRDALIRKARGVSDTDARRAPTASSLSLLGLLKHSTVWEERWFQGVVAGQPLPDGGPALTTPPRR